jgi:hypothetical protein
MPWLQIIIAAFAGAFFLPWILMHLSGRSASNAGGY